MTYRGLRVGDALSPPDPVPSSLQEQAFELSQKYKEGKFIIEVSHMIKDNGWEWDGAPSLPADIQIPHSVCKWVFLNAPRPPV